MEDRIKGKVKWFDNAKGYGFIQQDEIQDKDVFVHFRSIIGEGYKSLSEGQEVEFNLSEGPKGVQAEQVAVL